MVEKILTRSSGSASNREEGYYGIIQKQVREGT